MNASMVLPHVRRATIPIMATACGIAVANVYFCQPLLEVIARNFDISVRAAGLVTTAAQIGYALGIVFIVPLADSADLQRLTRFMLLLTALALVLCAVAPGPQWLIGASLAVAIFTVVPQVVIPTASALAVPGRGGRVIGVVSGGLILGILLSRSVSGVLAAATGTWRSAYLVGAVLTGATALVLPGFMPHRPEHQVAHSYSSLLGSLPRLFVAHREVRLSAILGALAFAAFSGFWASLAFHLAGPGFGLGPAATGLFGVWGAPGALMAPMMGRFIDRHGPNAANAIALSCVLGAFASFGLLGTHSIAALVIGVNLLDFGIQSGNVANQARIFRLPQELRARLNTLYMASVFSGGAFGSMAGLAAYNAFHWAGLTIFGGTTAALAGCTLLLGRGKAQTSRVSCTAHSTSVGSPDL